MFCCNAWQYLPGVSERLRYQKYFQLRGKTLFYGKRVCTEVIWPKAETQQMEVSLRGKSREHHHYQVCVLLSNILLDLVQFAWDVFCWGAWIHRRLVNNRHFCLFLCKGFSSFLSCPNMFPLFFLMLLL